MGKPTDTFAIIGTMCMAVITVAIVVQTVLLLYRWLD